MSLEDMALLEVLTRISEGAESGPVDSGIEKRLLDGGLAADGGEVLTLTAAGIAFCKSLQHRVAADRLVDVAKASETSNDAPAPGTSVG